MVISFEKEHSLDVVAQGNGIIKALMKFENTTWPADVKLNDQPAKFKSSNQEK